MGSRCQLLIAPWACFVTRQKQRRWNRTSCTKGQQACSCGRDLYRCSLPDSPLSASSTLHLFSNLPWKTSSLYSLTISPNLSLAAVIYYLVLSPHNCTMNNTMGLSLREKRKWNARMTINYLECTVGGSVCNMLCIIPTAPTIVIGICTAEH